MKHRVKPDAYRYHYGPAIQGPEYTEEALGALSGRPETDGKGTMRDAKWYLKTLTVGQRPVPE